MREILGQLEEYFNNTEPEYECDSATCEYKNDEYEIWKVSESVFNKLDNYKEEKWCETFPDSWWRYSTGSVLETPDTLIKINGFQLYGWKDNHFNPEYDDELRTEWESLTSYLCNNIGASQPKNVCALCVDLAKFNGLTLGELWNKCEPIK